MLLQLSQFFLLCLPPPSTPSTLIQSPHLCLYPSVTHISSLATPFPYCSLHPQGYSVTTYLYLIPSPLHPFPPTPLVSGKHQNALSIHESVSVLLVHFVCFLDSIVDKYVFIAILLFIVLIFFLKETL